MIKFISGIFTLIFVVIIAYAGFLALEQVSFWAAALFGVLAVILVIGFIRKLAS